MIKFEIDLLEELNFFSKSLKYIFLKILLKRKGLIVMENGEYPYRVTAATRNLYHRLSR